MADMVNISLGNAAVTALLGYAVVFLGIVALMLVILLTGRVMHRPKKAAPAPAGKERMRDALPKRGHHAGALSARV